MVPLLVVVNLTSVTFGFAALWPEPGFFALALICCNELPPNALRNAIVATLGMGSGFHQAMLGGRFAWHVGLRFAQSTAG